MAKQEGIHLGATAGTINILHRCYSDVELHEDGLRLHLMLSPNVGSFGFSIRRRGHPVHLEFAIERARVGVDLAEGEPINVEDQRHPGLAGPGQTIDVPLGPADAAASGSG